MIALSVKTTVILAAAFFAAAALRHRSAALRHFLWTAALATILLLPLFSLIPQPAPVIVPVFEQSVVVTTAPPARQPARRLPWLPILYGAGAALTTAWFAAGAWRAARIARRGVPSTLGGDLGIPVFLSAETAMPMACGVFRPIVVLPDAATSWPADRLRSVLLHETMHHRRRDLAAQAIAQAVCCLYWFNPLAWLALARQRDERERACDDAVLRHGVAPHDYATHLVDIVRLVAANRPRWSDAPAMAEASGLETRIRAVLNRDADRGPLGWRSVFAVTAALLLLAPISLVSVRAQAPSGLSGIVYDPSGARVPNCQVTATNLDGTNVEEIVANAAGEYRFANLPSGRYAVDFSSRGFMRLKLTTAYLVSGAGSRIDAHLVMGSVSETISVVGKRNAPAGQPAPRTNIAQRIKVGGNVQAMRLVRQPRPVYPPDLQAAGVEGNVVIRAVVSKQGTVLNPEVASSTDPRLNQAALDAVAKWLYQPSLLNGEPVETATTISIDFQLEK